MMITPRPSLAWASIGCRRACCTSIRPPFFLSTRSALLASRKTVTSAVTSLSTRRSLPSLCATAIAHSDTQRVDIISASLNWTWFQECDWRHHYLRTVEYRQPTLGNEVAKQVTGAVVLKTRSNAGVPFANPWRFSCVKDGDAAFEAFTVFQECCVRPIPAGPRVPILVKTTPPMKAGVLLVTS